MFFDPIQIENPIKAVYLIINLITERKKNISNGRLDFITYN
jgi:hypothetical protein